MVRIIFFTILGIWFSSCGNSQNEPNYELVGGPCEGCEAIFEYGNKKLNAVDTLPDFNEPGTQIKVTGTVYKNDGKTPAPDVILYVYHTNQKGIYAAKEGETGWGEKHGYIRGWLKTDKKGRYAFYTLKPAAYPSRTLPAHTHIIVLEPNGKYYWLDGYHYKGDSLLTSKEINPEAPRGGTSGLLELKEKNGVLLGKRDIILGENIAGYK